MKLSLLHVVAGFFALTGCAGSRASTVALAAPSQAVSPNCGEVVVEQPTPRPFDDKPKLATVGHRFDVFERCFARDLERFKAEARAANSTHGQA